MAWKLHALLFHFAVCTDVCFVTAICVESMYEAAGSNFF
jgi:hypothetical protein